jgi:hypothetical protein
MARIWLFLGAHLLECPNMLPFQGSSLTVLALWMTAPQLLPPTMVTIGLTAVCVIAVGGAILGEFGRNRSD